MRNQAKHKVQFKNYTFIRKDRPNAKQGGGTSILIKNNIKFKNIQIDHLVNQTLETIILKLKLQNDIYLFLILAYATSSGKNELSAELNYVFKALELQKATITFFWQGTSTQSTVHGTTPQTKIEG